MTNEWNHWSEDFDWENAEYLVRNNDIDGEPLGPIKGKAATLAAAGAWYERTGNEIEILEATHKIPVACISVLDGAVLVYDLHDDDGDRLPWRAEF
jgi:hypothetical protein